MFCCIQTQIQTVLESEWKRGKRKIQEKSTNELFLSDIYWGNLASTPCADKHTSATAGQTTFTLHDNTEHGAPFYFYVALINKYMDFLLPTVSLYKSFWWEGIASESAIANTDEILFRIH